MRTGRPPNVPLHGHQTVENALRAILRESEYLRPPEAAERLQWPITAVRNALYRLRDKHQVYRSPTGAWFLLD